MKHFVDGFGGLVGLLVGVAIDVDEGVFRPVGRRLARKRGAIGFSFQVEVKPVDDFVAPVGIGDRIDEHDEIFADSADHRLFGDGEAIGKLERGFGRTGFV